MMFLKRSAALLFASALFQIAAAQNCSSSFYARSGAKIESTEYDKKGAMKSVTVNTVNNVQGSGDINASIHTVKTEANGTVSEDKTIHYICNLQGIMIGTGVPDAKTNREATLIYPANMAIGLDLKNNVAYEFKKEQDGKTVKLSIKISDRKVAGKERITIKSGSWDCTKLTYKFRFALKLGMVSLPVNAEGIEWYNPEVGVVRTETWVKDAQEGYSELTSVSK